MTGGGPAGGGQQWSLGFSRIDQAGYSFQVVRSVFDQVLLDHARRLGVRVREGTRVHHIAFEQGRAVSASFSSRDGRTGEVRFRHLVDASGRAGLLAVRQLRSRRFHDVFRNVATWGYWRRAARVEEAPEGAICVFSLPDHSWLWAIPLHDGTLSVGLVTDQHSFAYARKDLRSTESSSADCRRLWTAAARPWAMGLGGHGTSLMTPWPATPGRAIAGLYLTLEPRLGLRRAVG
ncbi:NAD(P)/FAD-dependent oxidoreductase [Streptomyces rectiverticillatus]|uniref:NAD(P)/FAD-dependent oxidoreductase n=1 Tax=Streptomyces rectiverticillatus TaxID=173860 RepID=UPI001FE4607A|nr:tryptophan 7-halogenase [Streptomyces rectiverticillatus]